MTLFPPGETRLKSTIRALVAATMTAIGVVHFVVPEVFARIVPDYLPWPIFLVYLSGFFEIAGGVGLLLAPVRTFAAFGLVALYVAVFPANLYMATHRIAPTGQPLSDAELWGRLPLQLVFILTAIWLARAPHKKTPPA